MVACSGSVLISILNANLTDYKFQYCMISLGLLYKRSVEGRNTKNRCKLQTWKIYNNLWEL